MDIQALYIKWCGICISVTHTFLNNFSITIIEKEAMNSKNKEGYVGGFRRRKGKEEIVHSQKKMI